MKEERIQVGVHYAALHENKIYNEQKINLNLGQSSFEGKTTVSIPFHEKLSDVDIDYVVERVNKYANRC